MWFALIYYSSEADDFICLTEMMSGQTFTDCSAAIDETTEKGGKSTGKMCGAVFLYGIRVFLLLSKLQCLKKNIV